MLFMNNEISNIIREMKLDEIVEFPVKKYYKNTNEYTIKRNLNKLRCVIAKICTNESVICITKFNKKTMILHVKKIKN